jgi:hypothetical protein
MQQLLPSSSSAHGAAAYNPVSLAVHHVPPPVSTTPSASDDVSMPGDSDFSGGISTSDITNNGAAAAAGSNITAADPSHDSLFSLGWDQCAPAFPTTSPGPVAGSSTSIIPPGPPLSSVSSTGKRSHFNMVSHSAPPSTTYTLVS